LTLETFGTSEFELILDEVPGLLDAIFDLMDKLNPAVAKVRPLSLSLPLSLFQLRAVSRVCP